uniref:Uncharacterized protein n=1 Tax=Cannabis sativa TaxID=3483 RepID=A0A803QMF1_CANSA
MRHRYATESILNMINIIKNNTKFIETRGPAIDSKNYPLTIRESSNHRIPQTQQESPYSKALASTTWGSNKPVQGVHSRIGHAPNDWRPKPPSLLFGSQHKP